MKRVEGTRPPFLRLMGSPCAGQRTIGPIMRQRLDGGKGPGNRD